MCIRDSPYTVAAKTGTAQSTGRDAFAWFIAYAPAENPKIAVSVMIGQGAVSYTHLDVYKRQLQRHPIIQRNRLDRAWAGKSRQDASRNRIFAHGDRFALCRRPLCICTAATGVEPVSYTHLDVYKRQV